MDNIASPDTNVSETGSAGTLSTGVAPARLGQGYDTFLGTGKNNNAVDPGDITKRGSGSLLYCAVCADQKTLSTNLRLSGSASGSTGNVGVDAKAKFSQSLNFSSTSVAVVVYSSSTQYTESAPMEIPEGEVPADDSASVDAFVREYGDSYVSQIEMGGEYLAVYLFHAESVEQQTSISGKIELTMGGSEVTDFSDTAELQASLDTICTETQVRQDFHEMIAGTTTRRGDMSVIEFASKFGDPNFVELDEDGLAVLTYNLDKYENLTMPAAFGPVIANRYLYEYGDGGGAGLVAQYAALCAVKSGIESIQGTYTAYGYELEDDLADPESLGSRQAVIDANIATLEDLFRQMSANPTTKVEAPVLAGLSWGRPSLNYTFKSAGVYGGTDNGGNPFEDVGPDSVPMRTLLRRFDAWGKSVVDKIESTYSVVASTSSDGATSATETKYTHGGTTKSSEKANGLPIGSGDRVVKIWGTWGRRVNQIQMKTLKGSTFICPTHPESTETSYSWQEPASGDTFFVGFNGRSSEDDLNQLAIKIVTFNKTAWT